MITSHPRRSRWNHAPGNFIIGPRAAAPRFTNRRKLAARDSSNPTLGESLDVVIGIARARCDIRCMRRYSFMAWGGGAEHNRQGNADDNARQEAKIHGPILRKAVRSDSAIETAVSVVRNLLGQNGPPFWRCPKRRSREGIVISYLFAGDALHLERKCEAHHNGRDAAGGLFVGRAIMISRMSSSACISPG